MRIDVNICVCLCICVTIVQFILSLAHQLKYKNQHCITQIHVFLSHSNRQFYEEMTGKKTHTHTNFILQCPKTRLILYHYINNNFAMAKMWRSFSLYPNIMCIYTIGNENDLMIADYWQAFCYNQQTFLYISIFV